MFLKLERDYWDTGLKIHNRTNAEIKPGLTVLVGCNGAGKSTFLRQIYHNANNQSIPCKMYDNLRDGGSYSRSKMLFNQDYAMFGAAFTSSEGEEIVLNIGNRAKEIAWLVRKLADRDEKNLVLLFDAVDSGLSIDNVNDLKALFKLIMDDCTANGIEAYIVIAANEYELCRGEQCYDPVRCVYVTFSDYEDYRKFILQSRKKKDEKIDKLNAAKKEKNYE